MTSASRMLPPGWITQLAPASTTTSRPSRKGKKVSLATAIPGTGIWAVLSDVAPDGSAHPLTAGRLNTNYPNVVDGKSFMDGQGRIVQPFGDYSKASPAPVLAHRQYQVEFWPVGVDIDEPFGVNITDMALGPDDGRILLTSWDFNGDAHFSNDLILYDWKAGKGLAVLTGFSDGQSQIRVGASADGQTVLAVAEQGEGLVFDVSAVK